MAKRVLRITAASVLGILCFMTIVIILGALLSILVAFLIQIRIVEIAVRLLVTLPISNGWLVSEETALLAVVGILVYYLAYLATRRVLEKIGKEEPLPLLIVAILLLAIYIPSGILNILAGQAFWATLYGMIAAVCFIKTYKNLCRKEK